MSESIYLLCGVCSCGTTTTNLLCFGSLILFGAGLIYFTYKITSSNNKTKVKK